MITKYLLDDGQNVVHANGKQTFFDAQHELTIHTDVLDEHVFVILLQDSNNEHKLPGAQ